MDIFSSIKNNLQKIENYDFSKNSSKISVDNLEKVSNKESNSISDNVAKIEDKKIENKDLKKIIDELNNTMNSLNTSLKFSFDDKINTLTVKVVDTKTDEVIREFPPKEAIKLMEKMKEVVGLLFDKKG
jgi:flagellar protein FlaG